MRHEILNSKNPSISFEQNGNELFNGFLIENWADAFEREIPEHL